MRSQLSLIVTLLKEKYDPNQVLVELALRRALLGCDSVLDIGCGSSLAMRYLGVPHTVGVEGYLPSCEEARRKKTHDQIVHDDVATSTAIFDHGNSMRVLPWTSSNISPKTTGWSSCETWRKLDGRKSSSSRPMDSCHKDTRQKTIYRNTSRAGNLEKWSATVITSSDYWGRNACGVNVTCSSAGQPFCAGWFRCWPKFSRLTTILTRLQRFSA